MNRLYLCAISIFASSALLCTLACETDFAPASRVEGPRLLALAADPVFARPGEEVMLDMLVVGAGADALQWAVGYCTLPSDSTTSTCLEQLDAPLTLLLGSQLPPLQVPEGLLTNLPTEQRPSAFIGVVVVGCPGELTPGETGPVPLRCLDESGLEMGFPDLQVGVKRVYLRTEDRNLNPQIRAVFWDNANFSADQEPSAQVCRADVYDIAECPKALRHRIDLEVDAPEQGLDELGAAFEEQVIVQYYTEQGLFRDDVRLQDEPDNRWVGFLGPNRSLNTATTATTPRARIWLIVRDDRGGVSWTQRSIALVP